MDKRYFVKTRNWHCNRIVKGFLDLSHLVGVQRGDSYSDNDGKYYLETDSRALALAVWRYFMLFERFSGGWTYAVDLEKHGINDLGGENRALV